MTAGKETVDFYKSNSILFGNSDIKSFTKIIDFLKIVKSQVLTPISKRQTNSYNSIVNIDNIFEITKK